MMHLSYSELTASDYLLTVADRFAKRGDPFADVFRLMIAEARSVRDSEDDIELKPPLRQHEATPVDIIAAAYEAAVRRRDRAAQHQVVLEGLALLARWPSFLLELTAAAGDDADLPLSAIR